jgi:hypothetical protein
MQVEHGETLSERHVNWRALDITSTNSDFSNFETPSKQQLNYKSFDNNNNNNNNDEICSPIKDTVDIKLTDVCLELSDCANNLQRRNELIRIAGFLKRLGNDRVIEHNDSVNTRLLKRLEEGIETRAFVAYDLECIMNNYGAFQSIFPNITMAVRPGCTNRSILSALVDILELKIMVDSITDIHILKSCVADIATASAFSPHVKFSRQDITDVLALDVAIVRSPSRIRTALMAGVEMMCVGSISGIKTIRETLNSISKYSIDVPKLVINLSENEYIGLNDYKAGCSISSNRILSILPSEMMDIIHEANQHHFIICGIRATVSSLLDGSIHYAFKQILKTMEENHSYENIILVLDQLDANSIEDLEKKESMEYIRNIRIALQNLKNDIMEYSLEFTVITDISEYLFRYSQTLLTRIISCKPYVDGYGNILGRQLYIDDGIYSSLCNRSKNDCITAFSVGNNCPIVYKITDKESNNLSMNLPCTIWGQTCDSLDKVLDAKPGDIDNDVTIGDWLGFSLPVVIGNGTNTGFNGYDGPAVRFMIHTGFE